jgi:hypothetical protein
MELVKKVNNSVACYLQVPFWHLVSARAPTHNPPSAFVALATQAMVALLNRMGGDVTSGLLRKPNTGSNNVSSR